MTLLGGPVDLDARTVIREALDRNLFVEAGAGTGKTTVLVDRVVNLVGRGRISDPGRLVAITFTEAAAAELRDRIREALERAAGHPSRPEEEQHRCRAAVARIDEAFITTLHGFAQRLLAARPLEAGLPPSFDVDDEVTAGIRFAQRWREYCDQLFADPQLARHLEVGFTLGLRTSALREVALAMHRRWDRLVPRTSLAVTSAGPALRPAVESVLAPVRAAAVVAGALVDDEGDELAGRLRAWLELVAVIDRIGLDPDINELDELEALDALASAPVRAGAGFGRKSCWGERKAEVCSLLDDAQARRLGLLSGVRRSVIEALLPSLRRFTLDGAERRRRAGRLEFHDLLVCARDLLSGDPDRRAEMASAFDVVLIDEFQDTDPLQLDIAFALAAADPGAASGWSEGVPLAEGKLVIVGDPKQSIYGFRGADIRLWSKARDVFGPGEVQRLSQNFRSVPSVLAWVNAVFEHLIGEGSAGSQPGYERLEATRREAATPPAVALVGGPSDKAMAEVRAAEARDIAGQVSTMKAQRVEVVDPDHDGERSRPLSYRDIAILVPTRAPLGALERALDRADIPYRVESRSLVWATDVVRDLVSVLAAIDDPSDQVAVLASLRSPGFACADDALLCWRSSGGSWDYRHRPPDDAAAGPVAESMMALLGYHEQRWWEPVNHLVERVVRERRLRELAFAQRRPRDHWRRLRFVVDQARAFVEAGGQSLGDFVAWALQQSEEGAQAVETVVPEADDDAVRILTVHGSKGLEFPVAVLAGLNTARASDATRLRWGEHGPEVRAGTAERGYFETVGYAELDRAARLADAHESVRLLYVAATRARDHLVLSLHHKATNRAKPGSHAEVLWGICQDLVRGWRPAELPEQLVLGLHDEGLGPVEPRDATSDDAVAAAVAARSSWVAGRERLLAASRARRVLTASALADLADGAGPDDGPDAGPDAGPDDGPDDGPEDHDAAIAPVGGSGAPPVPQRRGAAIGRAVHGVLHVVDLDPSGADDIEALAGVYASTEGIPASVGHVAAMVRSALGAPSVMAARRSPRRWRELFVAAPLSGRLLEGYVDLLYEDDGGELVVVDYKTDRASSDAELDRAVARHRLQGAAYALAIEAALGRPVARCVFVFTRAGGAVERELVNLTVAVAEARDLLRSSVG